MEQDFEPLLGQTYIISQAGKLTASHLKLKLRRSRYVLNELALFAPNVALPYSSRAKNLHFCSIAEPFANQDL